MYISVITNKACILTVFVYLGDAHQISLRYHMNGKTDDGDLSSALNITSYLNVHEAC